MATLRSVFALCIALCWLVLIPSVAQAGEAQCRHRLIHDWYVDGQIQGQYRVSCYRAALADVPSGDTIYHPVRKDLSQALSSGIARVERQGIAAKPQTALPAPGERLGSAAIPKSHKSHTVLYLAALGFLLVLLAGWFLIRRQHTNRTLS
jgi:hypothetical protein